MTTLTRYTKQFVHYLRNTKAVSALEYALLIGAVVVIVGAALVALGGNMEKAIKSADKSIVEATKGIKTN